MAAITVIGAGRWRLANVIAGNGDRTWRRQCVADAFAGYLCVACNEVFFTIRQSNPSRVRFRHSS